MRWTLLACGVTAVGLGVVGIFLPVLPTVPFLLLALACFTRSSERFYNGLLAHHRLGPMVRPYLDGAGLSRASKFKAIALVWTSILLSTALLAGRPWTQATLLLIAAGVTTYLVRLPELDADETRD